MRDYLEINGDLLNLSGDDRITAMTAYFKALARA